MVTFGYKSGKITRVKPSFFGPRNCWRVRVPAAESETGKGIARYFATEEEAQAFIAEHHKSGSVQLAELSIHERQVLGLIRRSADYTPDRLMECWRMRLQVLEAQSSLSIKELSEAFYARQVKENRSVRTLNDDRWRLNKLIKALGEKPVSLCSSIDISRYLESIPPGTNRRSHFKTLKKLWRWAYRLGHVDADPMARMQPIDAWGINVEHLGPAQYARILRVVAGKEPPAQGEEVTTEFKFMLPYFVLCGLAGVRNCELIRYTPGEPVLEWGDILWNKNLIYIRQEVAKETRARDRKRYIPFETAAAEILRPLAGTGRIMPISRTTFNGSRRRLAAAMRIKFPENCLRNAYATFALTFRSLGDVAKAMGDAEATVKRYYVETLEPGVGREWFQVKL